MLGPIGLAARAIDDLDQIARGVGAIHDEFVGMRGDILTLDEHVQGLRDELGAVDVDVRRVGADVSPMRAGVEAVGNQVGELARDLQTVTALAARFGVLGRGSRRRVRDVEPP